MQTPANAVRCNYEEEENNLLCMALHQRDLQISSAWSMMRQTFRALFAIRKGIHFYPVPSHQGEEVRFIDFSLDRSSNEIPGRYSRKGVRGMALIVINEVLA